MSLLHKRSSLGTRKVSPPQPTCMSEEQKASYLAGLRTNRPARPTGSRPLPSKPTFSRLDRSQNAVPRSESANLGMPVQNASQTHSSTIPLSHSASAPALNPLKGRPLARAPQNHINATPHKVSPILVNHSESVARQMEKQEAHSLRQALEKIDIEDEESRIHSAAQMEAADLVWRHRNPDMAEQERVAAYRNPDLVKKKYVVGTRKSPSEKPAIHDSETRTPGDGSCGLSVQPLRLSKRGQTETEGAAEVTQRLHRSRRRSSSARKVSSGSTKGAFRNPEDQIYEETSETEIAQPEQTKNALPLRPRTRNSLPSAPSLSLDKTQANPMPCSKRLNLFEIHRNPPSQSRNAEYALNQTPPRSETPDQAVKTAKGRAMEIRSDEIRAATSMKRKDRSPNLPTPTAVSDRPGRPIVSFNPSWKPVAASPKGSLDLDREKSTVRPMPSIPAIAISAPSVPTVNVSEEPKVACDSGNRMVPRISLPEDDDLRVIEPAQNVPSVPTILIQSGGNNDRVDAPTITVSETAAPSRPLPTIHPQISKPRPLPSHTQSAPSTLPSASSAGSPGSKLPWLSRRPDSATGYTGRSPTVSCTACELPISGRIVTASGSTNSATKARFHPECFNCFHCNAALECVSFYPEPESALLERLKASSEENESGHDRETAPPTASDLRFYCHLDFHELFSPKCASCHTPIEGSIILAAGKAWHEGHFFCAECGDPFSSASPFVEAKGYAYCVTCHTKRTASRCRGCKNQILDEVSLEALGGKWHESCFVCFECERGFGPEGRFFVREIEIELTEKEKRKGADYRKIEERAVCERCEERRLKSWNIRAHR